MPTLDLSTLALVTTLAVLSVDDCILWVIGYGFMQRKEG